MIKKINFIYYFLLSTFILGSCVSKHGVLKRRYNKGYYVSVSKTNNIKSRIANKNNSINLMVNTDLSNLSETTCPIKLIVLRLPESNDKGIIHEKPLNKRPKNTLSEAEKLTITASAKQIKGKQVFKPVAVKKMQLPVNAKSNSDTNLIVLVILCFLWWLNLIAVYIHDGKNITLNFWITLLLDFTIFGGIIFSLLVILDVVDLK